MSNKIVPGIYRVVIDDVIAHIRPEFEEYGVSEDVLAELQHKWENKVIASHVAEFETPAAPAQAPQQHPPPPPAHHLTYPPHPMHMMQHPHYAANPYALPQPPGMPGVKAEPMDNRYMLGMPYALPPLPGPQINGARQAPSQIPPHPGGQTGVISFPRPLQPQPPASRPVYAQAPPGQAPQQAQPAQQPQQAQPAQRIPQVDGPSESSGDEDDSPPPSQGAFAPRTSHPSLPQPKASTSASAAPAVDSEAINSDLDDSDTEGEEEAEEGVAGESDIVFCTYDKVARVKNKWKCILKDGMIHINGKDYLFSKCTGEFEW
ncbi:putative transcription factor IIA, alpha/beta subunit [Lyophyllum shimeji]|uniref:Transcription factor IIA, alpha/beta subunit n=1 Tax=Lyophyllum shimeji TaxID=47721 RepID=A0A9P3PM25_LYOSH|nr:putative transcription factor IIA, alpha/beta subunit [Lyophyllum shimeji]